MSGSHTNTFPKLHNAMWPGLVGKGSPGAEPFIDLDTMLDLTAAAEVDGIKFDGVDIFLYDPHINIDISDDDLEAVADKVAAKGFVVGSVVAPVWFDASAMGNEQQRENYLTAIRKACRIAKALRELGRQALWRGPHRLRECAGRLGQGPRGEPEDDRRDLQESRGDRPGFRREAGGRGRDLLGRDALLAARWSTFWSASASRRPSAFKPTWHTRCCTRSAKTRPRTGSCPRITTGRTARPSTRP